MDKNDDALSMQENDILKKRIAELEEWLSGYSESRNALKENRGRLELAISAAGIGFWDRDFASGEILFNETLAEMLGYEVQEYGTSIEFWESLVHPDDLEDVKNASARHFLGSAPFYECEYRMKMKLGGWKWVLDRGKVIERREDRSPKRMVGARLDIDELKVLETQLRQAARLEAVGLLAGGVAHDLNNLLTPIIGYASLIQSTTTDPLMHNRAEIVLNAAQQAQRIIQQLLAFSSKQLLNMAILNLSEEVLKHEKLLRETAGDNIRIQLNLEQNLGSVEVDPAQIQQVLMNLVMNGIEAMPDGGMLVIETANVCLDAEYVLSHADVVAGEYIMLSVNDTGMGIDEDVRGHIFEPFFTTKVTGKGSGLGLAAVYGIVRQHNGTIWVYSEIGMGTVFKIYLPRIGVAPYKKESVGIEEVLPAKGVSILIVEDEEMVRILAEEVLESAGYTVLSAATPSQAKQAAAEYDGEIHLLLADIVLPEINGKELYLELAEVNPNLGVVYMSGYSFDVIAEQGILDDDVLFLQKPFARNVLIQAIRQAQDRFGGET